MTARLFLSLSLATLLVGCSSSPSPSRGSEQTGVLGGAVLGAAWGAGTGAIVGNQVGNAGAGIAIGAGLGAVSGAMIGAGFDSTNNALALQEEKLEALEIQNATNAAQLRKLHDQFDYAPADLPQSENAFKVYFDSDATNLKVGSVSDLETIANSIKRDIYVKKVRVVGHTDDTGDQDYNLKIAEARAKTVASYLGAQGVATDVIETQSLGATQPITSDSTPEGRQLNRRVDVVIVR